MKDKLSAIDTNFLVHLLSPQHCRSVHPDTKKPVTHIQARLTELIKAFEKNGNIIVPTPVLAELQSEIHNGATVLDEIQRYACFQIIPFGIRAACKLGELNRKATLDKTLKDLGSKQAVKIDRQILAMVLTSRAKVLYTDDRPLSKLAVKEGLKVIHSWDLPLSLEEAQFNINFSFDEGNVVPINTNKKD